MDIIAKLMLWPLQWYQDRPSTLINDRDIDHTVHTAKTCTSKVAPENMHLAVCNTRHMLFFVTTGYIPLISRFRLVDDKVSPHNKFLKSPFSSFSAL